MTKRYPRSFHCGPRTVTQIEELAALFGGNKSEIIRMAIDRMWQADIGQELVARLDAIYEQDRDGSERILLTTRPGLL